MNNTTVTRGEHEPDKELSKYQIANHEGRRGRVIICTDLLLDAPDDVAALIFSKARVLGSDFMLRERAMVFFMVSPDFRPVERGTLIPEYSVEVTRQECRESDDSEPTYTYTIKFVEAKGN